MSCKRHHPNFSQKLIEDHNRRLIFLPLCSSYDFYRAACLCNPIFFDFVVTFAVKTSKSMERHAPTGHHTINSVQPYETHHIIERLLSTMSALSLRSIKTI
jgi:hypothetical protein